MEQLTVLYDVSCGFFVSCRKWLEAQPAYVPLEFIPAGSPEAERLFPGLSLAAADELTAVGDDGSVYRGSAAWILCLWALRDYRSLAERLSSPSLAPLTRHAVRFVCQTPHEISQALALETDEEIAERLREISPPSWGRQDSFIPVVLGQPLLRSRVALPTVLLFVLGFIAFVFLANHRVPILLFAVDRGIVSQGATPRRLGLDLEAVLRNAARQGDVRRVRTLLALGADPNRGEPNALVEAALQNRQAVVQILRSAGANVDAVDFAGATALHYSSGRDAAAIKRLLAAGADPNARENHGETPLVFAVDCERIERENIEVLLAAGSDPNARSRHGSTPLMIAVMVGRTDLVCDLLAAGADPNARDEGGTTALFFIERSGGRSSVAPPIALALLDAGANPNLRDQIGETVLHKAARSEDLESIRILLARGADAGVEARNGDTPLSWAVHTRWSDDDPAVRSEIVRRLVASIPADRRERDITRALRTAQYNRDRLMQTLLTELSASEEGPASIRR